jgi:hypothetical protein
MLLAAHRYGSRPDDGETVDPALAALVGRWRWRQPSPAARADGPRLPQAPLFERPLPAGWSYLRVDHPRAFVAGFIDLGKRMATTGDPRVGTAQLLVSHTAWRSGGGDLEDNGLDGDSPLECLVTSEGPRPVYACTAKVSDPARLRERLGALAEQRSVGVALPWFIGWMAHCLPSTAAFVPFVLGGQSTAAGAIAEVAPRPLSTESLLTERVDDLVQIAGDKLWRRSTAQVQKSAATFEESLSVIENDRLWIYSDGETAAFVRALPKASKPGEAVAASLGRPRELPGLRGLVSDGVAGGSPLPVVLEIDLDSQGIHVRHQVRRAALATAPELLAA